MKSNGSNDDFEKAIKNMSEEQKEQVQSIRDKRDDKICERRNVMFQAVITFLAVALSMYCKSKECDLKYMGMAIGCAIATAVMLFVAQNKLIRQMGEILKKYIASALPKQGVDVLHPTTRLHEEICLKFWGVPFLLMLLLCLLSVCD